MRTDMLSYATHFASVTLAFFAARFARFFKTKRARADKR
jgi:hypothetical protein